MKITVKINDTDVQDLLRSNYIGVHMSFLYENAPDQERKYFFFSKYLYFTSLSSELIRQYTINYAKDLPFKKYKGLYDFEHQSIIYTSLEDNHEE